jgi:ATP-dependent exoDNAse (exonuclease V) alpha subunit
MYTAVTRAKQSVRIITDQRALSTSIRVTQEDLDKRKAAKKASKKSMIRK